MLKNTALILAEQSRCSRVFRLMTRKDLRVLAYHGFSFDDEHLWAPGVFMRPRVFEDRMKYLADNSYPVLGLDEALYLQDNGKLPEGATVITIDDGWYSTKALAHEILRKYRFPYTLYVSSYYVAKESPVFNMAVQYMVWKTAKKGVCAQDIGMSGSQAFVFFDKDYRAATADRIIEYGNEELDHEGRMTLLENLARALDLDYEVIKKSRRLSYLNTREISELSSEGVDVQLHTHRHKFSTTKEIAREEIEQNRKILASASSRKLKHFAYPSGVWHKECFSQLRDMGIDSAVTTDPGFNSCETNRLAIRRFVDFDNLPLAVFAAEVNGTLEIARRARTAFQSLFPKAAAAQIASRQLVKRATWN